TISVFSALPTIVDTLTIDGTTQPGFSGTPLIAIDGRPAGGGVNGFRIATSNCSIKSMSIIGFGGNGILVEATGNTLTGNFIGVDQTGTTRVGNGGDGINLTSTSNTIGGTNLSDANTISGNTGNGISIANGSSNKIYHNNIGLNSSGSRPVPNGRAGVA